MFICQGYDYFISSTLPFVNIQTHLSLSGWCNISFVFTLFISSSLLLVGFWFFFVRENWSALCSCCCHWHSMCLRPSQGTAGLVSIFLVVWVLFPLSFVSALPCFTTSGVKSRPIQLLISVNRKHALGQIDPCVPLSFAGCVTLHKSLKHAESYLSHL